MPIFYLPLDTEFKCKYRKPSVTSFSDRSLIALKNERCNKSGRLSPRINLQWLTKSDVVSNPVGISMSSSCESMLLIFGAELNDPILENEIKWKNVIKFYKANPKKKRFFVKKNYFFFFEKNHFFLHHPEIPCNFLLYCMGRRNLLAFELSCY